MPRRQKIGGRVGVKDWYALSSAGDAKRLVAWAIRSLRNGELDRADAIVFGQLGAILLKAIEVADFERTLSDVQKAIDVSPVQNGTATH